MLYLVTHRNYNLHIHQVLLDLSIQLDGVGIANQIVDHFPRGFSNRYVLIPHEFRRDDGVFESPPRRVLARSIALITENPGSPWFQDCERLSKFFAGSLFFNESSMLASAAKRKFLIPLIGRAGKSIEAFDESEWRKREFDYLFVGGMDAKRRKALASFAPKLQSRSSFIHATETRLITSNNLDGNEIIDLPEILKRSRSILNIHRVGTSSFEWPRLIPAMSNSVAIISEPCTDNKVMNKEVRYLSVEEWKGLDDQIAESLMISQIHHNQSVLQYADEGWIAQKAPLQKFIRGSMSLRPFVAPRFRLWRLNLKRATRDFLLSKRHLLKSYLLRIPILSSLDTIVRSQKRLLLENIRLRRNLQELIEKPDSRRYLIMSDSRDTSSIDVSVLIPCFNEGAIIERCLSSVISAAKGMRIEVIVCSDAGSFETIDVAKAVLGASGIDHLIMRRIVNGGVGATRNDLAKEARGRFLMMLDADNELFESGLFNLVQTLSTDAEAAFAYGLLAVRELGEFNEIMNYLPWNTNRLRKGNYIDAFSLIRKQELLDLGGYGESLELYGWEDYDLWCRFASIGKRGALHRNFVGIYNRSSHSMLSITNVHFSEVSSFLASRSPALFNQQE